MIMELTNEMAPITLTKIVSLPFTAVLAVPKQNKTTDKKKELSEPPPPQPQLPTTAKRKEKKKKVGLATKRKKKSSHPDLNRGPIDNCKELFHCNRMS